MPKHMQQLSHQLKLLSSALQSNLQQLQQRSLVSIALASAVAEPQEQAHLPPKLPMFSSPPKKEEPSAVDSFKFSDLKIQRCTAAQKAVKPDFGKLAFGASFSDHMFSVQWSTKSGWEQPNVKPFHNIVLHPAAKVLHYAIEVFEGMKAYRGVDNQIRLFRPEMNMKRMLTSATRSGLPAFDGEELLKCIAELVRVDEEWVPHSTTSSLYIRPTFIGTEPILGVSETHAALLYVIVGPVGAYYPTGLKPVSLYADSAYCRAWPGGVGYTKAGSNYGPTIAVGRIAHEYGCQQALWLFGPDELLTEVGAMNIFIVMKNEKGEKELITAPLLDGMILPGVTRQSLLEITTGWGEFNIVERYVSMKELLRASEENRILEIFGSGTACVVSPVERILYKNAKGQQTEIYVPTMRQERSIMQRLHQEITDIQYGRVAKPEWTRIISG